MGMMKLGSSVRLKLGALLVAISLVPLLVFAIVFINYFRANSTSDNKEMEHAITQVYADNLGDWLDTKVSLIRELIKQHPEFKKPNQEQILALLKVLDEGDKDIQNFIYYKPNGEGVDVTGASINIADRDYYKQLQTTKKEVIADMVVSKKTGKYVLPLAVPILDDSGSIVGIIGGSVSPETFGEMMGRIKFKTSGFGYLMSSKGEYYTYPDAGRVGKQIADYAQSEAAKQALGQILQTDSGSFTYKDEDGQKQSVHFETVPHTSWRLVVSVPDKEVLETVHRTTNWTIIFMLVIAAAVAAIAVLLTRRIAGNILSITSLMQTVATGDLRQRLKVRSQDEIGQLSGNINTMLDTFSGIVGKINTSVTTANSASKELLTSTSASSKASAEIAGSIQEIAAGTNIQLSGAEQSARAMEEMASGVQRIAESAAAVSDQVAAVSDTTGSGNAEMRSAVEQMNVISEAAATTARNIEQLNQHSAAIGQLIDLISDISNQTSLLSLNASIEAARAGEHGRGFSVVANEVKKLAEQTKMSVDNVTDLIRLIRVSTGEAATSMEQSRSEVAIGIAKMQQIGHLFEQIRASISDVAQQVQEISAASEQISAGTQEVTASMEEMVTIAQDSARNAALVANNADKQIGLMAGVASSTQSLDRMLNELNELTLLFQVQEGTKREA